MTHTPEIKTSNLTFKASKVNLDGTLATVDHLGFNELDAWMEWAYGKIATIHIERNDGKAIIYTDNGLEWQKCA